MEQILKFFVENGQLIINTIGAIVLTASYIVKFTPTQKDDTALARIVALLKQLSLYK